VERPDARDGRNVVVSKKRSERMFPGQELLGEGISNAGVESKPRVEWSARDECECRVAAPLRRSRPAHAGIRTHGLASNEGDFLVPRSRRCSRARRGTRVVQDDVGQAFDAAMARDGHGRQSKLFAEGGVRGNEAFDASGQKHLRVGLQELWIVTVDYVRKK